jgi:hypothetical protein
VTQTSAVDAATTKTATASCPAGQRALGGGGVLTFGAGGGAFADLALFRSEPTVDGSGNPTAGSQAETRPTRSPARGR